MDIQSLVTALTEMFRNVRNNNFVVDAFMLAPAYRGFMANVYVLAVSAPSLEGLECYDRIDYLVDVLHKHLSVDQRKMIDRVRVYNSIQELELHAREGFEDSFYDMHEKPLSPRMELVAV